MTIRIETDSLGDVSVTADSLFGAQTQRAIENFPVEQDRTIGHYLPLVASLVQIKQAAAQVNVRIGGLKPTLGAAIEWAAVHVLENGLEDQFPIHRLHGGGGTSANMNANEVLANLAERRLGGGLGRYELVHPNDHVNLHQSTNDVYPTACHLAIIRQFPELRRGLEAVAEAFLAVGSELRDQKRLARTCLQDAVETSWADLFRAYAVGIDRHGKRLAAAVDALRSINLGGTIVGREEDAPADYRDTIIPELAAIVGGGALTRAADLFDAAQNAHDIGTVSAELDLLARNLVRICKDLRLLGSGPEAGLGELRLPARQPGSSVMPGKINPVIPEFVVQTCFQVMGNHTACAKALDHAELDLNVWESVMVFNVLDSMRSLITAARTLADRCVSGLTVDTARTARNVDSTIPSLTRLMQTHGYAKVAASWSEVEGDMASLRRLLGETE